MDYLINLKRKEGTGKLFVRSSNSERKDIYFSLERAVKGLNEENSFIANDGLDYLKVVRDSRLKKYFFTVSFNSYNGEFDGRTDTTGWSKTFVFPMDKLDMFFDGENSSVSLIYQDRKSKEYYPRIIFEASAQKRISCFSKQEKRALCKFLRSAFRYPYAESILVTDDPWVKGFFFEEFYPDSTKGISGGIVPSKSVEHSRSGDVEKIVFSVHT